VLSLPPLASVSDIGNFWGRYRSSKIFGKKLVGRKKGVWGGWGLNVAGEFEKKRVQILLKRSWELSDHSRAIIYCVSVTLAVSVKLKQEW
jgi:hypothetical protein